MSKNETTSDLKQKSEGEDMAKPEGEAHRDFFFYLWKAYSRHYDI